MDHDRADVLGRSITDAHRFLAEIYKDVSQMLAALDGLLFDQQWRPTEKTRTSWALSNGSKPNRWLLDYSFRWYVPRKTELANIGSFLAFLVRYAPLRTFDQPVVLGAAARFPVAPAYKGLKRHWRKRCKGFDPIMERLHKDSGLAEFTQSETTDFLPGASHITGLVVPLCQLSGTDDLLSRCVKPLLAAQPTPRDSLGS